MMSEVKNEWRVLKVEEMKVRKGMRGEWLEIVVKVEGKEGVKLIGRKVKEFWSEREKDGFVFEE